MLIKWCLVAQTKFQCSLNITMGMYVMLKHRLLLIKMKKCYPFFIVSVLLSTIIYFLPRGKMGDVALKADVTSRLPNHRVHIFYDARFKNKEIDGVYKQWNYEKRNVEERIASAFYPALGLYSCNDPNIIDTHMKQISDAGIGVVVVLWWPEDFEESPPMPLLLKYADKYKLKVTIQIQNYVGRNIVNLQKTLYYFFKKYKNHPAFYKTPSQNSQLLLPMIYIYDSYLISTFHWNAILGYSSNYTVRGTDLDAVYIGLLVNETQRYLILNADFDGFYTYFPVHNSTFGSTWYNWPYIEDFAKERGAIFIPTISPGYNDRSETAYYYYSTETKYYANRNYGSYYMQAWMRAVISRSKYVSINSFNFWQQGTQIEPAQPKVTTFKGKKFQYSDYEPEAPDYYLTVARSWIIEFIDRSIMRGYY